MKGTLLEPIIYRIEDLEWIRQKYKPGQVLDNMKVTETGEESISRQRKRYTVVELFQHHVSCVDACGFRESFGYIELERTAIAA